MTGPITKKCESCGWIWPSSHVIETMLPSGRKIWMCTACIRELEKTKQKESKNVDARR